jgi:hypothetical protein
MTKRSWIHMNTHDAFKGDWIEVSAIGGGVSRRGQIVEVLGGPRFLHEAPDGALVEMKELG